MSLYLPVDATKEVQFRRLSSGALAFSPTYGGWLFAATLDRDEVWWAALSGAEALRLRPRDATDDSLALVLGDFRIEFDPTSARDGRRERLSSGMAFVAGDVIGFGAMAYTARHYEAATAIGFHGAILGDMPQGMIAYYARWRIVTGDRLHPVEICKIEGSGWPD